MAEAVLVRYRSQPTGAKWSLLGTRGRPTGVSGKIRRRLRLLWSRPPQLVPCLRRGQGGSWTFVTQMPATRHSFISPFVIRSGPFSS